MAKEEQLGLMIEDNSEKKKKKTINYPKKRKKVKGHFPCSFCDYVSPTAGGIHLHKQTNHFEEYNKERLAQGKPPLNSGGGIAKKDKPAPQLTVSKPLKLSAEELALVQMMISTGQAKDFNDAIKQGILLKAYGSGIKPNGGSTMNSMNPEHVAKQMMDAQVSKSIIDQFKTENGGSGSSINVKDLLGFAKEQLALKSLSNALTGGSNEGNQTMQMLQFILPLLQKNQGPDPNMLAMQQQMQALKNQLEEQRRLENERRHQDMMKALIETKQAKPAYQDFLMAQEKIRAEKEQKIAELQAQTMQQTKHLENTLRQKEQEMSRMEMQRFKEDMEGLVRGVTEQNMGGFSEAFRKKIEHTMLEKMDMGSLLNEKKESGWDKVMERVSGIAETVAPVIGSLMENRAAKMQQQEEAAQQQYNHISPEQLQQMEMMRQQQMAQQQGHPMPQPMQPEPGHVPGMQPPMHHPPQQQQQKERNVFPPGLEYLNDPIPEETDDPYSLNF